MLHLSGYFARQDGEGMEKEKEGDFFNSNLFTLSQRALEIPTEHRFHS
jgi:hypothetical protein